MAGIGVRACSSRPSKIVWSLLTPPILSAKRGCMRRSPAKSPALEAGAASPFSAAACRNASAPHPTSSWPPAGIASPGWTNCPTVRDGLPRALHPKRTAFGAPPGLGEALDPLHESRNGIGDGFFARAASDPLLRARLMSTHAGFLVPIRQASIKATLVARDLPRALPSGSRNVLVDFAPLMPKSAAPAGRRGARQGVPHRSDRNEPRRVDDARAFRDTEKTRTLASDGASLRCPAVPSANSRLRPTGGRSVRDAVPTSTSDGGFREAMPCPESPPTTTTWRPETNLTGTEAPPVAIRLPYRLPYVWQTPKSAPEIPLDTPRPRV